MKKKVKELIITIMSPLKRIGLNNYSFSIISNNCWGGIVSRDRRISYNSPTCGTYFFAEEYIKFISNLKYYLNTELEKLDYEKSKYKEELKNRNQENIVLGKIDDVEIVFVHYDSFEEAKIKWERRAKRVNFNNLLVKFSDQNLFKQEHFERFINLKYDNKIFFTVNMMFKTDYTYYIPDKWHCGYAKDDIKESFKILKVNKILNEMKRT